MGWHRAHGRRRGRTFLYAKTVVEPIFFGSCSFVRMALWSLNNINCLNALWMDGERVSEGMCTRAGMNVILQLLCCLWKGKLDLWKCFFSIFIRRLFGAARVPLVGCFILFYLFGGGFSSGQSRAMRISAACIPGTGCIASAKIYSEHEAEPFFRFCFVKLWLWQFFIFGLSIANSNAISVSFGRIGRPSALRSVDALTLHLQCGRDKKKKKTNHSRYMPGCCCWAFSCWSWNSVELE